MIDVPSPARSEAITVVTTEVPPEDWNQAALRLPEARLQQTVEAAALRRSDQGARSLFVRAFRGEGLLGQLFVSHAFVNPETMTHCPRLLSSGWPRAAMGVYRWFGGPLVFAKADYPEVVCSILARVTYLAAEDGVMAIQDVAPPFYDQCMDRQQMDAIFREFGFQGERRATIVLELDAGIEDLWKNLAREGRQKVNKGRKQGISIVEADDEARLRQYCQVRIENARRSGIRAPRPESVLEAVSQYREAGMVKVFLAEFDGEVTSGQMLNIFNGNIQLGGICYSDHARRNGLHANDLMQWHVVEWASGNGYRRIDWAGYTPGSTSEREAGINRFKAKWGGTVTEYDVYSKVTAPARHWAWSRAKSLARRFSG